MSRRTARLILAGGLLTYAALAVSSLRQQSATYDEGAHLPAGYTYLTTGDHRLNPEHPPLVKLLAAAPLVLLQDVVMKPGDVAWAGGRQWEFGKRFLYRWNDADRLLFWGRLPVVCLGAGLCGAVFAWTRGRFGAAAAVLALLLAVLSPDLLAHGQLVTTDLPMALFYFTSVVAADALFRHATWTRLALAGLAAAAAVSTKFSAPVLAPVLVAVGLAAVFSREPMTTALGRQERALEGVGARARHAAAMLAAIGLMAWLGLWASYGFTRQLTADPELRAELLATTLADDASSPVARAALAVDRLGLLPEAYVRGFLFTYRHAEARPTFLLGRLSAQGFPSFFAVSFLLKTPIPLLVLLVIAIALSLRARPDGGRAEAFLWLPVAGYALLTSARGLNIGHRHLLPIYPFLFVAAGRLASRAWPQTGNGSASLRVAILGLGAWYAAGTLRVHPHYLAYFNEIAGGPAGGYQCLVDSSLDWGQDLKGLKAWLDARGLTHIKLSYFGSADPAYYGIDAEMLPSTTSPPTVRVTRKVNPGDVLAVSATSLQGVYLDAEDQRLMERIRMLAPLGQVGYSIFVYRADFSWPPR